MRTASSRSSAAAAKGETIPWQQRPHLRLEVATEIAGISPASLYRLAAAGRVKLVKLAGRTLVETKSLVSLVNTAEPWTASERGAAARAKRIEVARANLR